MITFRKMVKEDAAGVEIVEKASFGMPWSRQSFWEAAVNKDAYYLLALDKNEIIGYAGTWLVADEAHIMNVAIAPMHRTMGLGRKMMEELIRIVKEKGVTAMTLEVRPSNTVARKLYEKMGFKSVGLRKGYYEDNKEDAMIMWLTKL
ncbi:MAG: ribosomal protein S18-alanine N-acetyltransferase [Selenomonadaceae bacterium]